MILTFQEKNGETYEVQDEHTDEVFESVKSDVIAICDKYQNSNRDLIIAFATLGIMADNAKQTLSNQFGADEIIAITGAVKL